MTDLPLASLFPPATEERWRSLVDGVLKGADFDRKLVSHSYDGLRIEPLYPKADGADAVGRAAHAPWRIAQRLDHPNPADANALALADLQGGADALVLVHRGAPSARGFGLADTDVDGLDRALAGVMLDLIAISVETAPFAGGASVEALAALAARRGHAPSELSIDFGHDPIGDAARTGRMPLPWPELARRLAEISTQVRDAGFGGSPIRVDTRAYHEAGAAEAQELAAALATGLSYLRALEAGGLALDQARDALSFLLVADADQFLTIAKLRALRRLWRQVEEACGIAPAPLRLHAETAWRMTTRRDPWVNMLRGTMAAFSAGIGGADTVTVLPFTSALGLPDAFARRVARNTQLILIEEANLWRVHDPVAGSGGFEALSEALAEQAWAQFQEIEREGGMAASLAAGGVQRRVAEVRAKRERAVATRRDPIVGTSEFPDLREAPVSVLFTSPRDSGERSSDAERRPGERQSFNDEIARPRPSPGRTAVRLDLSPQAGRGDAAETSLEPLPSLRSAEPFERLRDLSDDVLARTGARPAVFLATLGPLAAFSARAIYAKNSFEAGGFETSRSDKFETSDVMVNAFQVFGKCSACLCSSDEIYAAQAVAAATKLRDAGATAIYMAGHPGSLEEQLREAGVDGFLFVGGDILALLTDAAGRDRPSP